MEKIVFLTAMILGMLGVVIGAFGAHGLQAVLVRHNTLAAFQIGVQYHFYHVFALCMIGILARFYPHPIYQWAAVCMVSGILLFSGSLYILGVTGTKFWGAVTPIGGVAFIAGWILTAFGIYFSKT